MQVIPQVHWMKLTNMHPHQKRFLDRSTATKTLHQSIKMAVLINGRTAE